jgi:hypothetical protein
MPVQDIMQALRAGRRPLLTGEEGGTVVEMFTALCRSNEERRPVALPLDA